eukprot:Rhum_TRINITY_DN14280_c0_g1::Rhum_TRINITY_DN14280_c0_g1_i2::g.77074::m.77074
MSFVFLTLTPFAFEGVALVLLLLLVHVVLAVPLARLVDLGEDLVLRHGLAARLHRPERLHQRLRVERTNVVREALPRLVDQHEARVRRRTEALLQSELVAALHPHERRRVAGAHLLRHLLNGVDVLVPALSARVDDVGKHEDGAEPLRQALVHRGLVHELVDLRGVDAVLRQLSRRLRDDVLGHTATEGVVDDALLVLLLALAVREAEKGRVASHSEHLAGLGVRGRVKGSQLHEAVKLLGGLGPLRGQVLAVAAPRGVELGEHDTLRDRGREVVLRAGDDVAGRSHAHEGREDNRLREHFKVWISQ